MKTVNKKIWPKFFEDVLLRNKRFEIRKDEDDIQVGDILNLREWNPEKKEYTGREAACTVTYVFRADEYEQDWGLKPGIVIIGFARWN